MWQFRSWNRTFSTRKQIYKSQKYRLIIENLLIGSIWIWVYLTESCPNCFQHLKLWKHKVRIYLLKNKCKCKTGELLTRLLRSQIKVQSSWCSLSWKKSGVTVINIQHQLRSWRWIFTDYIDFGLETFQSYPGFIQRTNQGRTRIVWDHHSMDIKFTYRFSSFNKPNKPSTLWIKNNLI